MVASVIDNKANYYNSSYGDVIIVIEGDKKAIYVHGDRPLTVHLTGTDTGTMEYVVQSVDCNQVKVLSEKSFKGVELSQNKEMLSEIDDEDVSGVPLYVLGEDDKPEKEIIIQEDETVKEIPIYTITFDATGGTVSKTQDITNAKGELTSALPTPARDGYKFAGWFTATENGEKVTTGTVFSKNTTVYAQWTKDDKPKESYTITFNANGGKVNGQETATQQTDKTGKLTAALPTPTRDGYTFNGWFTAKEGGTKITADTKFTENTTLYAQWTKKDEDKPDNPDDKPNQNNPSTPTPIPTQPVTKPSTPATKPLGKNWKCGAGSGWQYTGADGTPVTGSRWIESEGHRYLFDANGTLLTGAAATATAADGSTITISPDGDILMSGNLYYLNPDRDVKDPRTCYVVTDYLRIRDNYAGQTYYDQDGITFVGWMKYGKNGLRYQTRIPQPDRPNDLYLIVWGVQDLPECQHPDYPGDAAHNMPAGRYFFDDEGVLVQKETWNDGKDGKDYYTNTNGIVTQERAK